MVIIYENNHRVLEEILKCTQATFNCVTDMHTQTQYAHSASSGKSTWVIYLKYKSYMSLWSVVAYKQM